MEQELLFSIIIPTYNRPERLTTSLKSLTNLNYPCDRFEVIIVDDGSDIELDSLITQFHSQLHLTLIRQPNTGPATARNTGAKHAKGKYLAFTDDDCTTTPNWLNTLAARFTAAPNDTMIGGRTLNALPGNSYSTASQVLIDYLYSYYNSGGKQLQFFASNNFALPAIGFQAIGGFDSTFPLAAGEDRELCDRWLRKGYKMIYAPEVQVYHAHELSLPKFWRQHFNYGRGAFCFHKNRAKQNSEKIKVEALPFYWNLLIYPLSTQMPPLIALFTCGLLFISQVANVAGFFWELTLRVRE
jgi:glycosyltransferase involved in cell wall biosynthesis